MGIKVYDVSQDLFTAAYDLEDVSWTVPVGARPLGKLCGMSGSAVYVKQMTGGLVLAGFMYEERAARWARAGPLRRPHQR